MGEAKIAGRGGEKEWLFWWQACVFWEPIMADKWITRALPTSGGVTSLGAVTLAGQSRGNRGIPRAAMRVLGSFAVVYVVAGEAQFGDGAGRRWTVRAGNAFLLFPDVPHYYEPGPAGPWDDIWLVFSGPVFEQWRREGWLDPAQPVWHAEPVEFWREKVGAVLTGGAGTVAALVEVTRLLTLLAELRAAAQEGVAPRRAAWLEEACRLLGAEEKAPDWTRFAARFGLSAEQFRKKFRAGVGVPPAQFRLGQRLEQAAARLRADGAPLRTIATELGFSDEFHFSKLFKRRTGLSPSAYRGQFRGVMTRRT